MTEDIFLKEFLEILQTEEPISMDTKLEEIEEWDSLTKISTISWLLEKNIDITIDEISTFKTVGEIANRLIVR